MKDIALLSSLILHGLIAGIFLAWSIAVMPGITRLEDRNFLLSMQEMNKSIQNLPFFLCFFGSVICSLILTFWVLPNESSWIKYFLLAGTCIYCVGVLGITIMVNVPLNQKLEELNLQTLDNNKLNSFRSLFEQKWVFYNNIRTSASLISFFIQAIYLYLKTINISD